MRRFYTFLSIITLAALFSVQAMAQSAISGTKTVGTGGDYANIKLAFDAINTNGISGDVVLQITSDQTITSSATLEDFGTTGSLTIYPTGEYEISGTFQGSLIEFDGCSNVTLDGSSNQSGSGQALTLTNSQQGAYSYPYNYTDCIGLSNGAKNIQIKNSHLQSGTGTSMPSSYNNGITYYYSSDGNAPEDILIQGNLITRAYYGIRIYGSSSLKPKNIDITNNILNATSNNEYLYYGVYTYYVENLKMNNNVVSGYSYDAGYYRPYYGLYASYTHGTKEVKSNIISKAQYGMQLYYGRFDGVAEVSDNIISNINWYGMYIYNSSSPNAKYNIHHNTITEVNKKESTTSTSSVVGIYAGYMADSEIHNNTIAGIRNMYAGTSSYPGYAAGIYMTGGSSSGCDRVKIYHNRITDVYSRGTDYVSSYSGYYWWYNPTGILAYQASDLEIYQNTINMNMPFTAGGVQGAMSSCITLGAYNASTSGHKLKNNILVNQMVGTGTETYCIYMTPQTTKTYTVSIDESDYNALYCSVGSIAKNVSSNNTYGYLDTWQAAGYGANSTAMEVSLTPDCHVTGQAAISEDLQCPVITSVSIPMDIDGETRDASNNRMGVDITNFTLALTNDLIVDPDKPEGLCEGTQTVQFIFGAGGNFDDGIERTLGDAVQTQWYKNGMPIVDTDTDNITISGNRLTINDLMTANAGSYHATFWAMDLEPIATSAKTITVVEPVAILSENMVDFYQGCEGFHDLTLSVETLNAYTVQWQKEIDGIWEDIAGATGNEFVLDFTEMTKAEADGKYRAKVIGDELCEPKYPSVLYTDTETEVNLYLPVSNETMEYYFDPENLCGGMDLEFYAAADGSVNGYQWQKYQGGQWYDITKQENATALTQNLKLMNVNETYSGAYRCKVLGNAECYDMEVFTDQVEFVVPPTFELLENPESQVICGGEEVRFQVIGNGLGEIHSYQWYKDGKRISVGENDYADDAMLIIDKADISNVGQYYCEIEVEDCRGELTFTSETAILYVLQETKITRQPRSEEVALGETAMLSVEAHMKGLVPPHYQHDFQWYKGGVELKDNGRIQGSKSSLLTIKEVEASDLSNDYYVVVKGQCGTDESVRVSISDVPTVSITMNPMPQDACEGSKATFEAKAKSTDATIAVEYEWYFNGMLLADGGSISGATTSKLEISDVLYADAGMYSVKAKLSGTNEEAMSKEAALTVNLKPVYQTMPEADLTIETDAEMTLEVKVDSESDVTYQWYKDGVAIAGATEAMYKVDAVKYADAGEYYCEAMNDCGGRKSDISKVTVTKKTEDPLSVFSQAGSGYELQGNEPNPFATTTTIKYSLPVSTQVTITLLDASGRKLAVIFEGQAQAGSNEIELDATNYNLSSGTYFYTVEADGAAAAKAMILVK